MFTIISKDTKNSTPADLILSRLNRIKSTGPNRWSACCPGPLHNRGDKNPSLSIAVGADDRVLLKCFAGCDVAAIVAALGLELADLFPPRPILNAGPIPPHQRPKISDRDLLQIIRREVCVVAIAGEELAIMPLSLPDLDRLRTATRRLFGVLAETARHG